MKGSQKRSYSCTYPCPITTLAGTAGSCHTPTIPLRSSGTPRSTCRAGADDRRVADGMGVVHPEWRRHGLGSALFSALETRLREHTTDVQSLCIYLEARHEGAVAFAAARQFRPNPADTYTEMRAVLAEVEARPVLPEGFILRSYREVNHLPTLVEALNHGHEGLWGITARLRATLRHTSPNSIGTVFFSCLHQTAASPGP